MHVRERHENTQRNVTFYRYVLEHILKQRNVVYNQRIGVQRVNTMGATCGTGTAHPSGAPEFTPRILVGFVLLDL